MLESLRQIEQMWKQIAKITESQRRLEARLDQLDRTRQNEQLKFPALVVSVVALLCALFVFVFVTNACTSHKPLPQPTPQPTTTPKPTPQPTTTPKPTPAPPAWLRRASAACDGVPGINTGNAEIVNVWASGRTLGDLRRNKQVASTVEIWIGLDAFFDERLLDSPKWAWDWLSEVRGWNDWDLKQGEHTCPYSLAESIQAFAYCGLKRELTFDTQGWTEWHGPRLHPELADDEVYVTAVRHILRALEWHGVAVHRIWVENEPDVPAGNGRVQVFTLDTYLRRVRRVKVMRDAHFPGVQIGAGGARPEWGVAAWRAGLADRVGYHAVVRDGDIEAGVQAYRAAGVPLGVVMLDEVLSAQPVSWVYERTLGQGLGGVGWTTLTTDAGCPPHWALTRRDRFNEAVKAVSPQ